MSIVKLNNRGVKDATAFGSVTSLGSMNFIKKLTASSSATLSFVNGSSSVVLDNTYKEYIFTFKNMHPATHDVFFTFNLSTDSGSNYNVTKTTTVHRAYHVENGSSAVLEYYPQIDMAQETTFCKIAGELGNENDESVSGYLHLFNPSDTTFAKHFYSNVNQNTYHDITMNTFCSGYGNITSAVDAVQFKMSSGNIDAGDICLYGIA